MEVDDGGRWYIVDNKTGTLELSIAQLRPSAKCIYGQTVDDLCERLPMADSRSAFGQDAGWLRIREE